MVVARSGEEAGTDVAACISASSSRHLDGVSNAQIPLLTYLSPADTIAHPGLRVVLVRGVPSPWSQAAKTIFELKHLPYVAAPLDVAGANAEIAAWSGQNSAPVVAWQDEPPINHWLDILLLAERLAPAPAQLPADPLHRALAIGLGLRATADSVLQYTSARTHARARRQTPS